MCDITWQVSILQAVLYVRKDKKDYDCKVLSVMMRHYILWTTFLVESNPLGPELFTFSRDFTDSKNCSKSLMLHWVKSPFTKLWQSCSNPHLKIRPIAIFVFYSLNYNLAARLQDISMLLLANCEVHTGNIWTSGLKYGPNEVRSVRKTKVQIFPVSTELIGQ